MVNGGVHNSKPFTGLLFCYSDYAAFSGMGISHGLKKCPPDCFLNGLSIPVRVKL